MLGRERERCAGEEGLTATESDWWLVWLVADTAAGDNVIISDQSVSSLSLLST